MKYRDPPAENEALSQEAVKETKDTGSWYTWPTLYFHININTNIKTKNVNRDPTALFVKAGTRIYTLTRYFESA